VNVTIAVTGASGQLGRLVIESLLSTQEPASIIAIARDDAKVADLAGRGVVIRAASYDDDAALRTALDGADRLLLVSGSEVGKRVAQHTAVIGAAKAAGVGFVAYTSAARAGETDLVLAPEHAATETVLRDSGLSFAILRNNWYTENYRAQIDEARRTGAITNAIPTGRVASASRVDYAAGAAAVLTGDGHEGQTYEFSGDVAWSFDDLAAAIAEIIGSPVEHRVVTPEEELEGLEAAGLPESTAGFVSALNANIEAGDLAMATDTLRTLIGRPTTPLIEGLRG
jgi:NAD(P)H dehydrogenase (quinone)